MEKLRVTGSKLPCVIRGEGEALRHLRPQPQQDQRELPSPQGEGAQALKRSLRRAGPGEGFQYRLPQDIVRALLF